MNDHVYVFSGRFKDRSTACKYTERQWVPEPDETATDAEYAEWESQDPHWELRSDLDAYLDSDFIETIDGDNRYEYLQSLMTDPDSISFIRANADADSNTLVLIFAEALGGFEVTFKSTPSLKYCGKHKCRL